MPKPAISPAIAVTQRGPNLSRRIPPGRVPMDSKMTNRVNIQPICACDQLYRPPICPDMELQAYSYGLITAIERNAAMKTTYLL